MLADRIDRIGLSQTLKISAEAKAMKAKGIDVINLSVGEPDFNTFDNIKIAAKKAIDDNFSRYTPVSGILELRQAIVQKLKDENGLEYSDKQIIVSCGAKHSLYNLCLAIVNPGDEVIIPSPYWVSYPEMVKLAEGTTIFVSTKEENGFRLTPEELKAAITPSTKALFLNNPCNPSGAGYSKNDLEELAEVIADAGIIVIADEIYEKFMYDGIEFISMAAISPKMKELTVVINGVSKAYSMTGWRVGYAAGNADIIAGMSKIQSHSTSNASSIAQMAGLEAIQGPQDEVAKMFDEFQVRRDYMLDRVRSISGVSCYRPRGAFYLFPNVKSCFDKNYNGTMIKNSQDMALYLLKEANVAVVPGDAFGEEGFIRLSYATSIGNIKKAIDRITEALAKLK